MADSAARVRVFSDDGHCVSDPALMRRALEYVKAFDGVVAQHAEEPRLTVGAQMHEGDRSARLGLTGWPAAAEEAIIARDVLLAGHVGARLHVCHVSTAGSVELLRWAKSRGVQVTAEVTPHHLLLTDACAESYDPVFKVNPPLRTDADVEALRAGAGRRHDRRRRHRPRPARGRGQGERVGRGPARDARAGAGALRRRSRRWSRPACSTGTGVADRMSVRPAAIGRLDGPRPPARPGRAGQPAAARPRRPGHRRPGRAGQPQPQQPLRRPGTARPRGRDVPAGRPDRARRKGAAVSDAILVLEDGRTFRGEAYGAVGTTVGEAVFATGMTGYQETLTDPSYHRQVVVMTAPHIGNTGVNGEDDESRRMWVAGLRRPRPGPPPVQLAVHRQPGRRTGAAGRRRHQRHRHPGADPAPARPRRDAGRHHQRARRRRPAARRRCRRAESMVGADLAPQVSTDASRTSSRRWGRSGTRSPRSTSASRRRRRGTWPTSASRRTCCRPRPPPRTCWPPAPTASSSPTDRATRPRPTTPSRR